MLTSVGRSASDGYVDELSALSPQSYREDSLQCVAVLSAGATSVPSLRKPLIAGTAAPRKQDHLHRANSPKLLIFRNILDSHPKSGVSSATSRLGKRGVSRSSGNAGRDAVDAAVSGVRMGSRGGFVRERKPARETTALIRLRVRFRWAGTRPVAAFSKAFADGQVVWS